MLPGNGIGFSLFSMRCQSPTSLHYSPDGENPKHSGVQGCSAEAGCQRSTCSLVPGRRWPCPQGAHTATPAQRENPNGQAALGERSPQRPRPCSLDTCSLEPRATCEPQDHLEQGRETRTRRRGLPVQGRLGLGAQRERTGIPISAH